MLKDLKFKNTVDHKGYRHIGMLMLSFLISLTLSPLAHSADNPTLCKEFPAVPPPASSDSCNGDPLCS